LTAGAAWAYNPPVSLSITSDCIDCGACQDACPTEAIAEDKVVGARVIDPERCTECVGFYERTMCQAECPVECCLPDPSHLESEAQLLSKARRLFPDREFMEPPPSHLR